MACRVGLVDYGAMGNIGSIRRALTAAGAEVTMVESAGDLAKVDKLVLPGVGGFASAMLQIHERKLFDPIRAAAQQMPTLGICLGMQLLARIGYEFGETPGFELVDGEVRRIECKGPVPHIGFNGVERVGESPLLRRIPQDASFYFMHSYEFVNYTNVAGLTSHFSHKFVSVIAKGAIHGVQFHPEKSRHHGIALLKNFVEL